MSNEQPAGLRSQQNPNNFSRSCSSSFLFILIYIAVAYIYIAISSASFVCKTFSISVI
jgi:hypothetical protein